MKEEYKNRINFSVEAEQFTLFLPRETGLPVTIYLDDGMAAKTYGHPTILFIQNSYNENDITYSHLICMTVDECTENVFNTPLCIQQDDYDKVKRWVVRNEDLIKRLSNREIDSYMFMEEFCQRITEDFSIGDIVKTKTRIKVPIIDRGEIIRELSDDWVEVYFDGIKAQVHKRALLKL